MDKFVEVEKIGLERLKEGSIKMKFEPLKNKIHNDFSCECKLLETEHFSKNDIKSAVCWLKFYLKQRKKGCDSIKIKSLLIIINESFEDVI